MQVCPACRAESSWRSALKRLNAVALFCLSLALSAAGQQVTVDITPGHSTNSFSPRRALGAGIDRDPLNSVHILFGSTDVQQMLSAGWGRSATG